MKNIKFSRLFAAALVVACLALTACKQAEEEKSYAIEGTWVSASEGWVEKWVISGSEVKNYGNDNLCYAGNSVDIKELTDTTGYIYFKYTRALCYEHSDFNNYVYTYDEDALDVGKWYALYYFNLTDKSVCISGAAGEITSCDSLDEAKKTFTVENGYMSEEAKHYSECVKK